MAKRADIEARLSLDSSGFKNTLKKSQANVKNFVGGAIRNFGLLAGAAGFGSLTKSAIDLGSKISDMAVQLNTGTDELQTLEFAAREAGVEVGIMERALRNVQTRTQEAINGNKRYGEAFQRLGIDINTFNQLPTEKKLEAIAVAQSGATDQAAAYNDVAIILGERAGPKMQEVLQNLAGPKGYGGLEAAAKRAGEIMSKETIKKMDDAADAIESYKRKLTVLSGETLGFVQSKMESLGHILGGLTESVSQGRNIWALYDESVDGILSAYDPLEDAAVQNAIAQGKLAMSADMATQAFYDEAEALDTLSERLAKQAEKENDIANRQFITAKELEALQLRAAGKNAEADALEKQIELTKEAMDVAKKYGLSLKEAAALIQGIQNNLPPEESDTGGAGSGTGATDEQGAGKKSNAKPNKGSSFRSKFGRAPTFEEREKASGMFLRGNDPLSGRRGVGGMTASEAAAAAKGGEKETLTDTNSILKSIDKEIKANP